VFFFFFLIQEEFNEDTKQIGHKKIGS